MRTQNRWGTLSFNKEVNSLRTLNDGVKSANIVRLVKSYSIGKQHNIIFPCAIANLHDCLRDKKFALDKLCYVTIRESLIWDQVDGIADALNKILTAVKDVPDSDGNIRLLMGYHFDLKPENILVEVQKSKQHSRYGSYTFKITDFGLSWFKSAEDGSNTKPFGGSPRYMPPEGRNINVNRKYDVWSLGCIFLEVTAFVVQSYPGVAKFDALFDTSDSGASERTRFWVREGSKHKKILRPDIVRFMDEQLVDFVKEKHELHEKDENFVRDMVDLIKNMLQPDIDQRYSSQEVVDSLRKRATQGTYREVDPALKESGETELGELLLSELK
jgi:serine/threonine protein kinase